MIVDGKSIKDKLINFYKEEIINNDYKIKLAIVSVGLDEPTQIYIRNKAKVCEEAGISYELYHYDDIKEYELKDLIISLNNNDDITGIIVELPLPKEFNKEEILNLIDPKKDVDGLSQCSTITPCTAQAVLYILNDNNISLINKKVTLIGYSNLIGKPLAKYFIDNNIDVTICNTKTIDLKASTINADVIITAAGVSNLVTCDMVKDGAVIIDCGITRDNNNKLSGDVDFDSVKDKTTLITPVPNGVGPVTTVMVVKNLIDLYKARFL